MKVFDPYKTFEDARGLFLGIVNSGSWEEVNYVETERGCVRGGHYHKETRELFFIIDGEIDVTIQDPDRKHVGSLSVSKGAILMVEPLEVHVFSCKTPSKWINILSKRIDDHWRDFHLPEGK